MNQFKYPIRLDASCSNMRGWKWRSLMKRMKSRKERRKARLEPESQPTYNRYGSFFTANHPMI